MVANKVTPFGGIRKKLYICSENHSPLTSQLSTLNSNDMKTVIARTLVAFFTFSFSLLTSYAQWTTITNGPKWMDTDGRPVLANGGNFLRKDGVWYLVGEDRTNTWTPDVNLYSSTDFQHWKFEHKIIKNRVTHPDLGRRRMIERPKLLFCEETQKYVVWCHWESRDYSASEAAVFECDSVNGDYEYVWSGRPMETKSRDCNVFVDNDGTTYFISTTDENQNLGLFMMMTDYRRVFTKTVLCEGQRREAPAIVHIDDMYYMISSACTGWDPNQAKLTVSKNLHYGWSPLFNIGDRIAYDTQASSILTIAGTEGTTYLYVGDRWMDPTLPESKIIILPIEWRDPQTGDVAHQKDENHRHMVLNYRDLFDIDFERGVWRE